MIYGFFIITICNTSLRKKTNFEVKDLPLSSALDVLFDKTSLRYKILENHLVVIIPAEKKDYSSGPITGKIMGQNNEPLAGVTVKVKGTNNGVFTDSKGVFNINVAEGDVLIISYVGYADQEIMVRKQTDLSVKLVVSNNELEQVVIIGYGTVKKKDLTGAVGVANQKDFGNVAVTDAAQLIQGKLAGVQVLNNNGLPGSGAQIIVRGTGSFTSVAPLYVIDDIQSNSGSFNAISSNDIESITVLKDASSVAIYGAQGANGVVIVTTKKGKSGSPKVSYSGYYGVSKAWRQLSMLNASQYIDLVKDIASSQNIILPAKLSTPYVLQDRTDWQDEIFQKGNVMEQYVSVSGGAEKINYLFSAGYTDQKSIMIGYDYKRLNLRFNLEEKLGRFKFGQNVNLVSYNSNGNTPSFTDALRMPPYAPTMDPENLGGYSRVTTIDDLNDAYNPLTGVYLSEKKNRNLKNYIQAYGEVNLINGLKFRSQSSLEFNNYSSYNYTKANRNGNLTNANGISENYGYNTLPLLENLLTYNKSFGIHTVSFLAGSSYRPKGKSREINANGAEFSNDDIRQIGVAGKSTVQGATAGAGQNVIISYFSRLNYSLLDKYLVTLSFRRDGNSVFGPENRFGNFPSVGVAWKVNEENFMKSVDLFSNLKLRASWGITGNANIPGFQDQPLVFRGAANNIVYSFGTNKTYSGGATISAAPNPTLKWEETKQLDMGLEAGFLKNKLFVSIDYYNRKNSGLLVYVPIPPSTGVGGTGYIQTSILSNAASAFNKGVETSISYNDNFGKLNFGISGNLSYNKNEVTSLGKGITVPIVSGGANGGIVMTRTDVGQSVGAFYGFVTDHVAIDAADIQKYNDLAAKISNDPNAKYQDQLLPGDIIFKDLNGDGKVTDKDQQYLGTSIPKWTYGLNLSSSYKGFDLFVALQGISKVKIFNDLNYWLEGTSRPFNGITSLLDRWKKPGDITKIPKAGQNANGSLNLRPSDRFIEDGSYMRIRNITLGYTLPTSFLRGYTSNTISSLRLYITAQNLVTVTNYKGYDPEISSSNNDLLFNRGIDNGQYPQPRTFLFGLQVGF